MNKILFKRISLFLLIAGVIFSWSCAGKVDSSVIRVGVIGPMQFLQGKGHWNGAVMAMEEINNKGGIKVGNKQKKIDLIKADSNEFLSITDATNAMERLIVKDKVNFIVGGFRTEAVLAMQDIAMDAKTIFIGVGAASPEMNTRVGENYDRYKYFFRGSPTNSSLLIRNCFIHLGYIAAVVSKTLNIPKVKVAVVGEKVEWVEPVIAAAKGVIPKMGMEVAGIWQPSQTATDVTAELSAIQRSGAHIIFTVFSASVGVTFAQQAGELKIPAIQYGINIEAGNDTFWKTTEGKCEYVITTGNYLKNVAINETCRKFIADYFNKFGEMPPYTAFTYSAIAIILKEVIEKAGSLDPEKIIPVFEKIEVEIPDGIYKLDKTHDSMWGPGLVIVMAAQWQDGEFKGIWPNKWKPTEESPEITFDGIVPVKLPPWMIEKYK